MGGKYSKLNYKIMSKFVRGKYAGKSVEEIQKHDPEYLSTMYRSGMNVFNSANLKPNEVKVIRDQQQRDALRRDCY